MQMIPPTGGDTFVGYSGFQYTSTDGSSLEVGVADVRQALARNWTPVTTPVVGTATEAPAAANAQPFNC
jgi:hypothetical protein